MASASLNRYDGELKGNAQLIAEWTADEADCDVFAIVAESSYPIDYDETAKQAKNEQNANERPLLKSNLLYTAVTRAKKICIVIGQKHALWYAVSHVTVTQRNKKLKERLQGKTVPMTYTHHDEETQTDMAAENKFE